MKKLTLEPRQQCAIARALHIAAAQYERDAATMLAAVATLGEVAARRLHSGYIVQAIEARTMADYFDEASEVTLTADPATAAL